MGSSGRGYVLSEREKAKLCLKGGKKMAAVAAEPGASAALNTPAGDGAELEPEIAQRVTAEAKLEAEATKEFSPVMDLVHLPKNGDAAQGCGLVHTESQCKPDLETVGSTFFNFEEGEHIVAGYHRGSEPPTDHESEMEALRELGYETQNLEADLPSAVEVTNVVHPCDSAAYLEPAFSPDSSAEASQNWESLHHMLMETSVVSPLPSLVGLTEPRAEYAYSSELDLVEHTRFEPEIQTLTKSPSKSELPPESEANLLRKWSMPPQLQNQRTWTCNRRSVRDETESELKPTVTTGEDTGLRPESIAQLIPGSEVRVALDHIIDDALVVSFRLGEKIFSGVLMDLSKRFGPYGIPVTVFPKREYRDKPESMQLKTEPLPSQTEKAGPQDASDAPPKEPAQTSIVPNPALNQWTSKPPPLFQEGAPYPPPLFIRDTYSQSIPQPPPRKIKRPKRKLYREEPTSIMNAIKLRPRQVLCDKCKGAVVTGDKRDLRKGPVSDCRGEEAKRRRSESTATVGKRPRTEPRAEERGRANDGARRPIPVVRVTALAQAKGSGSNSSTVKTAMAAASSPANNSSKVQQHTKKVLQNKNVDHSKTGEAMRRRQRDRPGSGNAKISGRAPVTRASCPRDTHQKVHFTRRLHQISGGGKAHTNPLPPRIRIKPQRYRNEENDSSTCKPPGYDKALGSGSRSPPKFAPPRCTSTRSYSSGEATIAAENHGPAQELKTEPRTQTQSHPKMETSPQPPSDKEIGEELDEPGDGQEKQASKAGNIAVYVPLNPGQPDSSNISVCSVDSTDDLKSSNSECSSTETFDFPPPGALHSPPVPSTSSVVTTSSTSSSSSSCSSSAPKEDKRPSKSLKAAVFSKNVSKCVTTDGRTICVGDIVWAKIYGFPWWPARILVITVSRKDNGLLVRQEARISWFGSPTTSFLALSQVTPFLENFQLRFDKKRKGLYRKAITEAAKAAKQLTPEVRALLTQFET
ncbi:hypothetical protein AGOR_G00072170 [Albula goreensis]|uniref:PWWP domain-containing protein n=1 Tax=Albula goreensis TaxID=1534307 RepID=A0A8T3DPA8_9TELE|nr:hypothetical protein AGOR_G00072170 [Albula goreensis]